MLYLECVESTNLKFLANFGHGVEKAVDHGFKTSSRTHCTASKRNLNHKDRVTTSELPATSWMVSGIKHICSKMTNRFAPERHVTRLETFRDMAEDLMSRSHLFLNRADHRSHTAMYTVKLDTKWTSKRARIISVIVFAVFVSLTAVITGFYYAYFYHPSTDKLFKRP